MTTATTDEERVDRLVDRLLAEADPDDSVGFLGHQFDLGIARVQFPEGHGGLGLSPDLQRRVNARIAAAGGPLPSMDIGYGMGAPTIATHGTDEQRRRWLRPMFTGEEIWCQLFSEPGAGSDVAGLATRAVADGDEWVVNGQKVWTSLAHLARWGMLAARTDPEVPKHRGLTYFVVDMHTPGVEVRPLRQMTGHAEFNEVYFTDARIPDDQRIDAVGAGWRVALTTLMNERVSIGGAARPRGGGMIDVAVEAWHARDDDDPARRDQLMRVWIEAEVLRLTTMRASAARKVGVPGPEGSILKLAVAETNQRVTDLAAELLGPAGMILEGGYDHGQRIGSSLMVTGTAQERFLRCRANSIEGGTSEVMRNILGERVLGLPGDIRVDKDVAWSDVPKN